MNSYSKVTRKTWFSCYKYSLLWQWTWSVSSIHICGSKLPATPAPRDLLSSSFHGYKIAVHNPIQNHRQLNMIKIEILRKSKIELTFFSEISSLIWILVINLIIMEFIFNLSIKYINLFYRLKIKRAYYTYYLCWRTLYIDVVVAMLVKSSFSALLYHKHGPQAQHGAVFLLK